MTRRIRIAAHVEALCFLRSAPRRSASLIWRPAD
jgi:hypothetical protein